MTVKEILLERRHQNESLREEFEQKTKFYEMKVNKLKLAVASKSIFPIFKEIQNEK